MSNPPKPNNRPGLPALAYRIGDYGSFYERLLERLSTSVIPDGPTLGTLTTRDPDDTAIALLDAWAVVADVLTFYQERIANEGYLPTATERRSLLELARMIGYELDPGVAASTLLAFTVEDTPSSPGKATVPKGTQIMSVPGEGELPQIFETSDEIVARAEWNALKPRLSKPQDVNSNTQQLYLNGISTQLQVGDRILLVDGEGQDNRWYLLTLETVEPLPNSGNTRVTWKLPKIGTTFHNPRVFAFRQRAALFGHNAPKWNDMPDEIKRAKGGTLKGGIFRTANNGDTWATINAGLPNTDIRCLSVNPTNGYLFAGTSGNGVFRSKDNGNSWTPVNTGLTNPNVQSLHINERGYLFVGTPGGGVFRSKDDGESWSAIGVGTVRVESQGRNKWESINTGLPDTGVRSLATYNFVNPLTGTITSTGTTILGVGTAFTTELSPGDLIIAAGQTRVVTQIISNTLLTINTAFRENLLDRTSFFTAERLFAGTDDGLYCSQDGGKTWILKDLPNIAIRSLVTYDSGETLYIFAGTDSGVFCATNNRQRWEPINQNLTETDVRVLAVNSCNGDLFAGTKAGVFCSTNRGESWEPSINAGLTNTDVQALAVNPENEYVFAGTKGGVFRSTDNGTSWDLISPSLPSMDITSLAIKADAELFAGTRFGGFVEKEWPGFEIQPQQIDLDTLYPQILPDSWIVLLKEDGTLVQPSKVKDISTISRSDFMLDAKVTSFEQETPVENPSTFERRSTVVLARSEALELAVEPLTVLARQHQIFQDPIWENRVFLSEFVQGLQPEKTLIVSGKRIRANINAGGVFHSTNDGENWERSNEGLTSTEVQALVTHQTEKSLHLFAGTREGVFRSTDKGKTWKPFNEGLRNTEVQAIAISQIPDHLFLFAGTQDGVFRSTDNGKWELANRDLKTIQALAVNSESLFAGTKQGVFRSSDRGNTWTLTSLTNADIQTFAIAQKESQATIWVGTANRGIFRSKDDGNSWQQFTDTKSGTVRISSQEKAVTLEASPETSLQEGDTINAAGQTRTITGIDSDKKRFTVDEAFRPDLPAGTTYTVNTGLTNTNITAIAIAPNGHIFAGTAGSGVFRSTNDGERWEQINTDLANLDIRCLAAIGSNGDVLAGTVRGGVFRYSNGDKRWKAINTGLTNTDVRAIAIHEKGIFAGGVGILLSPDGLAHVELKLGDILYLMKPPAFYEMKPPVFVSKQPEGSQVWTLSDRNGFGGLVVTTTPNDISLLPAGEDDERVSEVCSIQTAPDDQEHPVLALKEALQNSYDPATTVIYGNVVPATHGETVREVLGSGNGAIANQRFVLKKPPLTYVSAATASGAKSTLEVRLDGVLWQEVPSLYGLTPLDQKYIVRIEDDGTTLLTFGDGKSGARLPNGQENVVATYRSGIGLAGQVKAHSLSLLKTRPLGIQEVTNPVPATGAASPESRDEVRAKAPSTVRTLDRIVSLQDFEDFARAFAGIGKAQAVPLWNGATQLVYITVAARDGGAVPSDSALYENLIKAIDSARDPLQLVEVSSYDLLLFNLEATVLVDPRYEAKTVLANVETALLERFAFEKRAFGQAVTASEAIAAIQDVKGVIAVDLDALYRASFAKSLEQSLSAETARWDREKNESQPAQLLLLNRKGISLKI